MIQEFEFSKTKIPGLIEIMPFTAKDNRGLFIKDYAKETFKSNGLDYIIAEVFYSSNRIGTLRGLHFQRIKQQAKLVRCLVGHVWDVVVDLRKNSSTFKEWISFDLTEENRKEILVPTGCAHGFLAIEESIMVYKCSEKFYGEYDDGIFWNSKELDILWPLDRVGGEKSLIISEKDKNLQEFKDFIIKYGGF